MPIGDSDGVHCTFSSMPADAELCVSDSFPSQVNFHVALSPVTQGSKPFLVWETPTVQRMTPNYAYKSLLEGGYIDDSNRDLMQKALFLGTYPHFSNRTDRKLANFAANFFNVHLWSMRHRADPAGQVPGQYAAIDVGEALAFDAFQKHAGVVFNITDDRYSMVFRTSGSALEGDDVVTNHPHLYKNEQDSLYMEKALAAMEEIFGYKVREKIFEDGAGDQSTDFTAISVEPRPGAVSIDGMLRHFEAAKGFFAQKPLVLSEEAVRKIIEAEAMQV
ncbi:unnamed protein product [Symbiodinium natans]|uniref:Uncharacterized protein n=1 Tax=Symbiodinium natans TaxID=878477 RepID=A0A812KQU3_9DINO|nr:unnamed protein product [Symbiodinium natans]